MFTMALGIPWHGILLIDCKRWMCLRMVRCLNQIHEGKVDGASLERVRELSRYGQKSLGYLCPRVI